MEKRYPRGFRFSKPVKPEELEIAYQEGMVRPLDLKDGIFYYGRCRNAVEDLAVWVEEFKVFVYQRSKFGSLFLESIHHPEQDDGFDLFTPEEPAEPSETLRAFFDAELEKFKEYLRKRA